MRRRVRQQRSKRILVRCIVGIGVAFILLAVWWGVHYYRVEIAIHGFASNPSQARANKLTALLDRQSPTRGQAARILKLLLWPTIATRSTYPVGRKPTISATIPCYLHFPTGMMCRVDVRADGQVRSTSYRSIQLGTEPEVLVSPVAPERPGKLRMEVRYHYLLAPPPKNLRFYSSNPVGRFLGRLLARMNIEPWVLPPQERWYQVRIRVPVEIGVVEKAKAEQVQLLSDPELDRRMKDLLRPEAWYRAPKEPAGLYLRASCLPANVAFHCFLELPDGTRTTSSRPELRRLRAYAGWDFAAAFPLGDFSPLQPGTVALSLGDFMPLRPGTYDAKFVFEPDPNCALDEPTIKAIWNGRLEFPIRFTVAPEPNAVQQKDSSGEPRK
jgi:hypothetical protein